MSTVRLSKLHATGNDFLVCDGVSTLDSQMLPTVLALCDRHRGVGADGVLFLLPSDDGADCRMILTNADGTTAEMSGNGIRCLAWVAHRAGLGGGKRLIVDTGGGRREVALELDEHGDVIAATVDMGPVMVGTAPAEITVGGVTYDGEIADVGNPHIVLFVDDPDHAPVTTDGPVIEHDPQFPNRTNVEFIAVTGPDEVTMRVWERGVGETLSCGTGVCAAAAAARHRGLVGDRVTVHVSGGDLVVELGATAQLGGPVRHVFDVDVDRALIKASSE